MNRLGRVLQVALAFLSTMLPLAVAATPIPVGVDPTDDLIFNFDFTSSVPAPPYLMVAIDPDTTGLPTTIVSIDVFGGLDGGGGITGSATFTADSPPGGYINTGGTITDGLFSVGLRIDTGSADLTSLRATASATTGIVAIEAVPEPATLALLGIGLAGFAFSLRRRSISPLAPMEARPRQRARSSACHPMQLGRGLRVACGFAAGTLWLFAASANAALIHQWTFNDANDATPNDIVTGQSGTLYNGASIVTGDGQGLLQLDGVDDYFRSATFTSPNIDAKTLVVWLRLDNLAQRAGGALTLEDYTVPAKDLFDAIVYAEKTPNQWMGGSDNSNRTPLANNGGAAEAQVDPNEVMIAITYSGGGSQTVSLYRNGFAYASYITGTQTFSSSSVDALIGLRHEHNAGNFGTATGNDAFLAALVNEARIYDTALTASEISGLYAAGPLAIPEPRGLSLLFLACAAATAAVRARTA